MSWPYRILPISILYGVWHTKGGVGGSYIAQSSCNNVMIVWAMQIATGEGLEKDDSLVHKSFEVNEYLVKADP